MDRWTARPTWTRARPVDGGHRPSSAGRVVSGGPDCGRGPDLSHRGCSRRNGGTIPAVSRVLVQGLLGALVAFALVWPFARHYFILHDELPSYAAASSADLAGWLRAAREHVDGAMAPGARRQGAAVDLGRAHRLPRMDHARARRGRRRRLDAKPRRARWPRSLLHRPWRDRSGAGTRARPRAKSHPDRSAGRRSVSSRACQG